MTEKNAPYVIQEAPGKKFWCACGESERQPYCDGSHKRKDTGKSPIALDIAETKIVSWCGCKQSKTPPFCDGSHRALPKI